MTIINRDCVMCQRTAYLAENPDDPFLIYEFSESFLIVGEHQFYRGYCQLIYKHHAREMYELEASVQAAVLGELMMAARAVARAFEPWKMNYSCYGNVVPHVHWHLIPRYASDPMREQIPWLRSEDFFSMKTSNQTAREISALVRRQLN